MYKVAVFNRDWKDSEVDDWDAAAKLSASLPDSEIFEFGNEIIDEYVVCVTNHPNLEDVITESLEGQEFGHSLWMIDPAEDGFISFESIEELQKRVEEANNELEN